MFFLTLLGVATHRGFLNFYRYFIILSFVIGAMLTPPEPVSQVLMASLLAPTWRASPIRSATQNTSRPAWKPTSRFSPWT